MLVLHVFNDSVGNCRAALQDVSFNSTVKITLTLLLVAASDLGLFFIIQTDRLIFALYCVF